MLELSIETTKRTHFVDITALLQDAVRRMGILDGGITVFVPHTTAGVTINENCDPDVVADMQAGLEKFVPWSAGYRHSEGNSAAHIKASLMGSSVRIIVADGRLRLGTWQAVYFCEFDGPRSRHVWVSA